TKKPLVKDEEAADVDVHFYRSMIGSLMYLTSSKPDIMYAVCACSRFQVTPKTSHLQAVKRIFRYLKGQLILGLWYSRESAFDLEAYSDIDYAGANLDRKSTIGGCQFLGRRLISWQCKKQTIVATSTIEAEYVAAASCCGQNPMFHSKTKHIEIRHHFIRDAYEKKPIQVLKIHTVDNVADLLTKALDVISTGRQQLSTARHKVSTAGDQPPLTESSSKHDTSQDPRVNLEGTCGSGGDQVKLPHNRPLLYGHTSDRAEGSLNLKELSALCTNLSNGVLALETVKDAQAKEILTLKARIKKLEKRCKPSISHYIAWLRSVSLLSKNKKLSKRESVSKQGRKNANLGPTKDDSIELDDELDEDMPYMDIEEAMNEGRQSTVDTARLDVSIARPDDDTARLDVSTARQELSTADSEDTDRPARSILTLKPLPTIDLKDKGKGVLEEPESAKKMTKSDFDAAQIARDEDIA
nr:hypothetical protein [Tanacetum cinerariifolium]